MELNLTKPIAFIDLETTGVQVASDRIVEICILKVYPDGKEEVRTEKVNPGIPIPPFTTAIHGISDEDVADKPTFKELAPQFLNMLENTDLAGYNSNKFDMPMLVEEFLRAGFEFDIRNRRLIDIQNIFHKMEQRTLKAAYKFYCGKNLENAHSAEADTVATYHILKAQLDKYEGAEFEDRSGNVSKPVVNDMQALADFSRVNRNADLVGHIIFNDKDEEVFNFGKNKGQSVEKIFAEQPSYYDWMMKSEFPLSTKTVITAIKLRGFNKNDVKIK